MSFYPPISADFPNGVETISNCCGSTMIIHQAETKKVRIPEGKKKQHISVKNKEIPAFQKYSGIQQELVRLPCDGSLKVSLVLKQSPCGKS